MVVWTVNLDLAKKGGEDLAGGLAQDGFVEVDLYGSVVNGQDADVCFGEPFGKPLRSFGGDVKEGDVASVWDSLDGETVRGGESVQKFF